MTHSNKQMNAGYTIDQTILIIAIIAILITIIIATVGWDLLQRAGGAKVASHLRQIEGAIGEFYSRHGLWPHEAANLGVAANSNAQEALKARILNVSSAGVASTGYVAADHKSALPSYTDAGASNGLDHGLSPSATTYLRLHTETGGVGSSRCGRTNAGESIYVIEMDDVPFDEVRRADQSVDGGDGNAAGRLRWTGTSGNVDITFCANRF